MTASAGTGAKGTTLIRSTYLVAELKSIGSPPIATDFIELTNHDSPNGFREWVPGLMDGGEVPIEGNFIPGDTNGQIGLLTDQAAKTLRAFIIAFPNALGASWEFNAYVTKFEVQAPFDGVLGFTGALKVTGAPTLRTTGSTGLTTPFFTLKDSSDTPITPSPAASGSVYEYDATALTGATHFHVTPTAAAGVIHVNGVVVASGGDSGAITLGAAGTETLATIRVTETNKAPKIYRITVLRASA